MPTRSVAGIVLAAGTSSRMGRNKLLLVLDGQTLLRGAVRRAAAGGLAPLVVVLGAYAESAAAELEDLPCQIAVNPDFAAGIASSIRVGLSALPPSAPAAMILLADMPLVTADMIREMVLRYQRTQAPLVASDYDGINAPPMLYDRRLFAELEATTGEHCARLVVRRHLDEAELLHWPHSALADVDVPDDYARMTHAR
jgi:molybdenum cofactor cytidylyltransferase